MRSRLLVLAALSSALLLAACGSLTSPPPSDSGSPSVASSETPADEATSTEAPIGTPAAAGATVVGTCVAGPSSIPAIYVAYSDESFTPITLRYTVFNADGTVPVVTETVTGPIVTRISYPCVDESAGGLWTFTATVEGVRVGCAMTFGGQLVAATSEGDGGIGSYTATCSGNPGT